VFNAFTDNVGTCGPRTYNIYGHRSATLNATNRKISVSETDFREMGEHEIMFIVELRDYP